MKNLFDIIVPEIEGAASSGGNDRAMRSRKGYFLDNVAITEDFFNDYDVLLRIVGKKPNVIIYAVVILF
ncbi:hypothetical protein BwSH20_02010 [Bradyrhizobium ottawaense]|nr:hypothetical protein BwSH14_21410 [Bradyrhizobium ottawaense]GMO25186.1 hypothetical protein BwSF21_22870 [Bradyrhizobium ottawaense]GMO27526.1 hypothetical protein BwSF12_24060 [Bradyrhizobium ottawaense]GMO72017.1 hypothetical protein BwSH17_31360 [Bradyrhizobium ottawaense]GMO73183.1 hypothetical protein BwSF19_14140 [Bradyrhizobium ottawaense]